MLESLVTLDLIGSTGTLGLTPTGANKWSSLDPAMFDVPAVAGVEDAADVPVLRVRLS